MAKAPDDRKKAGGAGRRLLAAAPWLGLAAMTALWVQARQAGASQADEAEPGPPRPPTHPHRLPLSAWRGIAWRTIRSVPRDRLSSVAGGVTFFSLLSIFPATGVFVSLYGLFADVDTVTRHLDALALVVPQEGLQLVASQMIRLSVQQPASLSFAFAVSFLLSLWSANAGMGALLDGLNVAYKARERRNFFLLRGVILAFTVAALIFALTVLALLVVIPLILDDLGWDPALARFAWLRWPALAALAAAGLSVLYRFGPSLPKERCRWVTFGAALAAVSWVAGSAVLSFYINHIANYDLTYGSIAAVIGFMMWIWLSVMAVLVGAELNHEIEMASTA